MASRNQLPIILGYGLIVHLDAGSCTHVSSQLSGLLAAGRLYTALSIVQDYW